jgi:hypothetical protein
MHEIPSAILNSANPSNREMFILDLQSRDIREYLEKIAPGTSGRQRGFNVPDRPFEIRSRGALVADAKYCFRPAA